MSSAFRCEYFIGIEETWRLRNDRVMRSATVVNSGRVRSLRKGNYPRSLLCV